LVHRDVKPGNVLLDDPGGVDHAYLTDFGLTKSTDSTANLTDTGEWVGTLDYVAPEQIEAKGVDARTDVYALGCLLYHAVGGEVPFPADNYAAKVWAHLNKSPPQLAGRVPGVPDALDRVVAKAMEKNPDDRYQSAGAMGEAVLAAVDAPATAATPPSARPRGAKAAPEGDEPARRRFGTALKVAGVAALAAVAALIGTLIVPSGGGGNVATADVRALLERYQADFTNEDVPALETLLAPGFQRVYLSDPPVDRARSIAKYRIRFAAAKTPRFVITGVRIDTGTHDATAVGRYSLTAAGQPHLGDV